MNRARVEELKRREREAYDRVQSLAELNPPDLTRYRRALVEWKSARLALRSAGVTVRRDAGPEPPARRAPGSSTSAGARPPKTPE